MITLIAGISPASARSKILVMGDSISAAYGIQRDAGWVALLDARLSETASPWQVVNASISGETTGGGLARLPKALEAHDPEIVIIELGGNDGLRGYPVSRIRENLDKLVALAVAGGRRVLLLGMRIPPNYGPRYTSAFEAMYRDVAKAHDVRFVPFILEAVALNPGLMQDDGIHPTAEAQPKLLDSVWPELQRVLDG
ncbi:MAG: arylesterase [Pseudomonadales bacterium]|nr:arylesterase [Pseudomonadales bacterium]NIX08433.1 arylesterase [Pseudomonadales bacterium]